MAIKPLIPKGTRDFKTKEIARRDYIKATLRKTFKQFGFQPIETPAFERLETLTGQYGEEGDRLIFKMLNSGEKIKKGDINAFKDGRFQEFTASLSEKALRYDLTVPFARFVAQHQNELTFPFRRYQIQPVWRADRPQRGRFQEFYQCDADIVGERSLWQEVEMILLYDAVFGVLGLSGVKLKINHRKILAGITHLIEVEKRLVEFTTILDKRDKIGHGGIVSELMERGFSKTALEQLEPLFNLSGSPKHKLQTLENLFQKKSIDAEGIRELRTVLEWLNADQLDSVEIDFDLSLARGLHYYTGMIVEATAPEPMNMGSIGGGGRYDDLTSNFGLKDVSGIGISFGFERIYMLLDELKLFPKDVSNEASVLFTHFDEQSAAFAFKQVCELRRRGVSAEFYPTASRLKKQLSYANQKEIPLVVLIGSKEIQNNRFIIKNMKTGEQTEIEFDQMYSEISDKLKR